MMRTSHRLLFLMPFAACLMAGPTATLTGRITDTSLTFALEAHF